MICYQLKQFVVPLNHVLFSVSSRATAPSSLNQNQIHLRDRGRAEEEPVMKPNADGGVVLPCDCDRPNARTNPAVPATALCQPYRLFTSVGGSMTRHWWPQSHQPDYLPWYGAGSDGPKHALRFAAAHRPQCQTATATTFHAAASARQRHAPLPPRSPPSLPTRQPASATAGPARQPPPPPPPRAPIHRPSPAPAWRLRIPTCHLIHKFTRWAEMTETPSHRPHAPRTSAGSTWAHSSFRRTGPLVTRRSN